MKNGSEIPDDLREKAFRDWLRVTTANAIIHAQYVEKVLNCICLLLKTKGLNFTLDDFLSGDSTRTKQTLGVITTQLRDTKLFDAGFSERLTTFTRRRNRVVHGLFADTFHSKDEVKYSCERAQTYVHECEWVASEASDLVEVGFGIYRVFGETLIKAAPDDEELKKLVHAFDDYHELGIEAVTGRTASQST